MKKLSNTEAELKKIIAYKKKPCKYLLTAGNCKITEISESGQLQDNSVNGGMLIIINHVITMLTTFLVIMSQVYQIIL